MVDDAGDDTDDDDDETFLAVARTLSNASALSPLLHTNEPSNSISSNVIRFFVGRYAQATPEELTFYKDVGKTTGVVVDPVYVHCNHHVLVILY